MNIRLVIKTFTYGVMHLFVSTSVSYLITEDIIISLSIGIIEPAVQTLMFAAHDYLWEHKK